MKYYEFITEITERNQIKAFIEENAGVKAKEQELYHAFDEWWGLHSPHLAKLPESKAVMDVRKEFSLSFTEVLANIGLLDRFKVAGVMASWWEEVRYELRTFAESNFIGLVESWVGTIKDALEQNTDKNNKTKFDPLNHKLVKVLLASYLDSINEAEAKVLELEQEKQAFEKGEEETESDEDEESGEISTNIAKELENKLKELKAFIKDKQARVKKLKGSASVKDKSSILAQKKLGNNTKILEDELIELENNIAPIEKEIREIEDKFKPYEEIKVKLGEARRELKVLKDNLNKELETKYQSLSIEECEKLVLSIFYYGLKIELEKYVNAHRQEIISIVQNWWDKYKVTLRDIEKDRDEVVARLNQFLEGLGYGG